MRILKLGLLRNILEESVQRETQGLSGNTVKHMILHLHSFKDQQQTTQLQTLVREVYLNLDSVTRYIRTKSHLKTMRTSINIVCPMHMNVFFKSRDLIKRSATNRTIVGKNLGSMDF